MGYGIIFKLRPPYPREGAPGTHCVGVWVRPRADLHPMVKRNSLPLKRQISFSLSLACRLSELVAYFKLVSQHWRRTSCQFRNTLRGILGPKVSTTATYLEVRVSTVGPGIVYVEGLDLPRCDSASRVYSFPTVRRHFFLRSVSNHLSNNTAAHLRDPETSSTPL